MIRWLRRIQYYKAEVKFYYYYYRLLPQDSELGWIWELWSNTYLINAKSKRIAFFFFLSKTKSLKIFGIKRNCFVMQVLWFWIFIPIFCCWNFCIFWTYLTFLDFYIFFLIFFILFIYKSFSPKVTKGPHEHQTMTKISQNCIKSPFCQKVQL